MSSVEIKEILTSSLGGSAKSSSVHSVFELDLSLQWQYAVGAVQRAFHLNTRQITWPAVHLTVLADKSVL